MDLTLLQDPAAQSWIAAGAILVALILFLVVFLRSRPSAAESPPGLPRSPEGWEPLGDAEVEELLEAVRRSGEPRTRYYRAELSSGQLVALGHTPRYPWVDVFVRRRRRDDPEGIHTGPYEIHSYHLREERWSYGAVPPGRKELEGLIREGFAEYLAGLRKH